MLVSRRSLAQLGLAMAMMRGGPAVAAIATPAPADGLDAILDRDLPRLPLAREATIEVVMSATGDGAYAGIVVHNGSDETVGLANVTGTAHIAGEIQVSLSEASVLAPYVLAPGGYGIGLVRFDADLPADCRIEFEVRTDLPDNGFLPIVDLTVQCVTVSDATVSGTVVNTSPLVASPLVAVIGIFFADDGAICGWFRTYLSDYLDPDKQGAFQTSNTFGEVSGSYAIAASGWAEF